MTNGLQVHTDEAWIGTLYEEGHFDTSLDSTYQTQWRSWWVGMDVRFKVLALSFEYHTADYEADAYWNLRGFGFTHEADGTGLVAKIGIDHTFSRHWRVGLLYGWNKWYTDEGIDKIVGQAETQTLNEVNWTSQSINLSLSYKF
jgi:hypothetical protein